MKTKAYSYLRFSTPDQAAGDSYRRQSELAARYAAANGLTLDEELTFRDLGVSAFRGKNAETGALGAFLEAVREEVVPAGSVLLVEALDRISRRTARKAVRVLEEIVESGVDVVTLNDGKRYSLETLDGFDFLMAVLLMIRGHEESATKGRRVRAAWQNKRENAASKVLTVKAPGWIHIEKTGPREWSEPALIPDRAAIVKRIFRKFIAGKGKAAIAHALNAEGVPTFGRAKVWHKSYIAKILSNPAAVGVYEPHTFEDGRRVKQPGVVLGYYPAAVDAETWKRAQALLKTSDRTKGGSEVRNLLAGLAKCPGCGGTMTRVMKGARSKPKLVCVWAKSGAGGMCSYRAVDLANVEQALITSADALGKPPAADEFLQSEIEAGETTLHMLSEELDNMLEAVAAGLASEALAKRIRQTEASIEQCKSDLAADRDKATQSESRIVTKRAARLRDALAANPLDPPAANAALRECFTGVVVDYNGGVLRLAWRHDGETLIPFAEFENLNKAG